MIHWIGWLGVAFGLILAPPQLWKIIKTGRVDGISKHTYIFLCLALTFYLIYAISIKDAVFIVAQSVNLCVNTVILWKLLRG